MTIAKPKSGAEYTAGLIASDPTEYVTTFEVRGSTDAEIVEAVTRALRTFYGPISAEASLDALLSGNCLVELNDESDAPVIVISSAGIIQRK